MQLIYSGVAIVQTFIILDIKYPTAILINSNHHPLADKQVVTFDVVTAIKSKICSIRFQSADPITIQQQRATGVEIEKKENVPL